MFKKIKEDKYLKIIFISSVGIFLVSVFFMAIKFFNYSDSVIIHFDAFKGINVVGSKYALFGFFIFVFSAGFLNFFLADFIYNRERFLSYIFSSATLLLTILFFAAVFVIASVN